MTLEPGGKIGPYEILARLGAGGMGEVWRARDPRLNRDVAIKTSHRAFNPRFEREARAVAALNHPNVCHLYDVGPDYLVMELVEGENLRGPLPLPEALKVAAQIASALEAAHEKGIIHRDLKPANIRITPSGTIKVLDFGLARIIVEAADPGEMSTVLNMETKAGTVLGTTSYMSPEQARGKPADKRTDIWAFGIVLYEILTDTRPFTGDTMSDLLAGVLMREPDLNNVPFEVRRLLRACLEKDPNRRLRDIGDWERLLDQPLAAPAAVPAAVPAAEARRPSGIIAAVGVAALVAGLAVFAIMRQTTPVESPAEPIYRMLTAENGLSDTPALSRDGKFVAYASDRAGLGNLDIWMQQIGGGEAIHLTKDADDETDPVFSPDGTHIAYRSERAGGGIYIVQALGGDPVLLAAGGRNPAYSPDGKSIAFWTGRGELSMAAGGSHVFVVDAGGGQPRAVHAEMAVAQRPVWSPAGDSLLVRGQREISGAEDFWILPVSGGEVRPSGAMQKLRSIGWTSSVSGLHVEAVALEWIGVKPPRLFFAIPWGDSANIWESETDSSGLVRGTPRRRTRGSGRQTHSSFASADNLDRLAFSDLTVNYDLWSAPVDPAHAEDPLALTRITDTLGADWAPSVSADGRQIAYIAQRSGAWNVLLRDTGSGRERIIATSPTVLTNTAVSADGTRVAWSTAEMAVESMLLASGERQKLCDHCGTVLALSADGRYASYEPAENEDVYVIDTSDRRNIMVAARPEKSLILTGTQFSRDGKWIAFYSIDHSTRTTQIHIAPFHPAQPVAASEWIDISDGKGFSQDPMWAPAGDMLYFVSGRDGFRCVWEQRLDPVSRKPAGEPVALRHLHSARQTLRGFSSAGYLVHPAAAPGRIVFSMAEIKGSIWLEETSHRK